MDKMQPAYRIIERLGGAKVVCEATGTVWTAPYRWTYSKDKGGTGGFIPHKHWPALMALAKRRRVKLTELDFVKAPRARTGKRAGHSKDK